MSGKTGDKGKKSLAGGAVAAAADAAKAKEEENQVQRMTRNELLSPSYRGGDDPLWEALHSQYRPFQIISYPLNKLIVHLNEERSKHFTKLISCLQL